MSTPAADKFPVRPLAALLLALAAQTCLEPPARVPAALALYLLAAGFAVWSFRRGEWTLPDPPSRNPKVLLSDSTSPEIKPQDSVKRPEKKFPSSSFFFFLLSSFTFLSIAFYLFGDNRFTPLNLSLWLAGIAFFVRAFWQGKNPHTDYTDKRDFSDFIKTRKSVFLRQIRAIRVPLLIFLIFLIAAFFRFHHLASVPAEPFSDHAEKLFDVYDITQGEARVFFPRNTGREAIQFYWTLLVAAFFRTGLSFQSLKIGTALLGFFTLPFIYLLGREIANRRAGLLAMLFAGVAYWPNVISRIGLRFPLYPLFAAPTFYFLLRGLRTNSRNDFLLSGLFLGLTGLTRSVILPFAILAIAYAFYVLRKRAWILAIAFMLTIAPWIVRNSLLHHKLTGIETSMGYNLYLGYHPQGNGSFVFGPSLDLLTILDDAQRDRVGTEKAIEFIRAEPGRFIPLAINRLGFFFGLEKRVLMYFYGNDLVGFIPFPFLLTLFLVMLLPFVVVSLSAALGASLLRWTPPMILLGLLFFAYVTPHVFILAEDRFHLALVPSLAILAALFWTGGWKSLAARWDGSRAGKIAVSLAVLAALLLLLNWGLELHRDADKIIQLLGPNGNHSNYPY